MTSINRRRLETAIPWIVIGGLLLTWQIAVVALDIKPFVLPSPTAIFAAFIENRGPIMQHAMFTLTSTMSGFALGVANSRLRKLGIEVKRESAKPPHSRGGAIWLERRAHRQ